jgi:hypothetical protein
MQPKSMIHETFRAIAEKRPVVGMDYLEMGLEFVEHRIKSLFAESTAHSA